MGIVRVISIDFLGTTLRSQSGRVGCLVRFPGPLHSREDSVNVLGLDHRGFVVLVGARG
jgi:hypothetical protein